jgi:glutathione S-transferase
LNETNITKLEPKKPESYAITTPVQRVPVFVDADRYVVTDDHILYLYRGEKIAAVFHTWEYFERMEPPA